MSYKCVSKDMVAEALRKRGYKAENKNGVVITYIPKSESSPDLIEAEILNIFSELNYNASYGFHFYDPEDIKEIKEIA